MPAPDITPSVVEQPLALVVEDDAIIREELRVVLERAGVRVLAARDGREGLELFLRHFPDLIITDIRMPVMDGLEMIRRIRSLSDDVCIVIASAFSDQQTLLSSINLAVNGFVTKPILREELLSLARRCSLPGRGGRALLRKVLDHNPDLFLTTNGEQILYMNRPLMAFLGLQSLDGVDALELISQRLRSWDGQGEAGWLVRLVEQGGNDHILVGGPTADGTGERTFLVRVSRLPIEDSLLSVVSFADVTRIREERDFYLDLALKDALTGLANRKRLDDDLRREVWRSERYGKDLSLIMFDIDDFKLVNDTHGHQIGDHVLCELAALVRAAVRRVDLVARYGGEEFCVMAPETTLSGACELAEKLRQQVAAHEFDAVGRITVSFGVAQYLSGESPGCLVGRADQALYQAKRGGKNRVECALDAASGDPGCVRED